MLPYGHSLEVPGIRRELVRKGYEHPSAMPYRVCVFYVCKQLQSVRLGSRGPILLCLVLGRIQVKMMMILRVRRCVAPASEIRCANGII